MSWRTYRLMLSEDLTKSTYLAVGEDSFLEERVSLRKNVTDRGLLVRRETGQQRKGRAHQRTQRECCTRTPGCSLYPELNLHGAAAALQSRFGSLNVSYAEIFLCLSELGVIEDIAAIE